MTDTPPEVAGSLQRIQNWFEANVDQAGPELAPPATDAQLAAVEDAIGASLPAPVRAAYQVADGQRLTATHPLFPNAYRWSSLQLVLDGWNVMLSLFEGDDSEEFGKEWWHPGLVPLAENGAGDGLYVDLDGRNDGVVGETIQFYHDDWPFQRTARTDPTLWATDVNGFGSMLGRYADDLEAGRYTFDGRFVTSNT